MPLSVIFKILLFKNYVIYVNMNWAYYLFLNGLINSSFKCFMVLISNITRYNSHYQKLFGLFIIFLSLKGS